MSQHSKIGSFRPGLAWKRKAHNRALLLCCSAALLLCCSAALLPCSSAVLYFMLLKSSKHSLIWHPKSLPNWSQIDLGAHSGGREICSGRLWPLGRLLERSWTRMGPKKTKPEATEEIGFSMPGSQISAQKDPQEGPKSGSKNDPSWKWQNLDFQRQLQGF